MDIGVMKRIGSVTGTKRQTVDTAIGAEIASRTSKIEQVEATKRRRIIANIVSGGVPFRWALRAGRTQPEKAHDGSME